MSQSLVLQTHALSLPSYTKNTVTEVSEVSRGFSSTKEILRGWDNERLLYSLGARGRLTPNRDLLQRFHCGIFNRLVRT